MKPGSPAAALHPVHEAEDPHLAKQKFLDDAAEHVRDTGHRAFVRKALGGYYTSRDTQQARYRDWEQARACFNAAADARPGMAMARSSAARPGAKMPSSFVSRACMLIEAAL